ncbi:MAG: hypothetical protein WBQ64_18760, partial [Terriglobales bacterium]
MAMPKLERGLPRVTMAVVMTRKAATKSAGFCRSNRVVSVQTLGKMQILRSGFFPRVHMNSHGRQL